ncbi:MAG: hypothetical protein WB689_35310 [Xanthobacteraceae bacterium]
MNPAEEMAAKPGAAGSDEKSDQQLHTILENLGRVAPQDDLHSGLTPRLDLEALERKALDDRLGAIENQKKKRSSRGFTRYLLAICIGAAATLAWQSYGEAAKQIFAAKAPELGWSPETKRMIANLVEQLGWIKPPATSAVRPSALETPQAVPVAQTAPENVTPKAPAAPSIDPEQVQRMAMDLTALRQTVEQLAVSQDQMVREIARLKAADGEILAKVTPAPPPPPPIAAAPAVAGRPAPGGAPSSANTQTDVALRANCGPDVQRLCRGISWENDGVIKCLSSHRMELSPICVAHFNAQKGAPKATSPNW